MVQSWKVMMRNVWVHIEISELWTPLSCRWKLNGSLVNPKPGSHHSLSGGNLRISHLNKDEDAGTYQCLASNKFGTIVSREASLTFACKSHSDLWSNLQHRASPNKQDIADLTARTGTLALVLLTDNMIKMKVFSLRRALSLSHLLSFLFLSHSVCISHTHIVHGPHSVLQLSFIQAWHQTNEIQ